MTPLFLTRRHDSPTFDLIWGITLGSLVVASIFWNRTGRRTYEQWRARNWPVASGKLNRGEIITMLKGRTKEIAGYVVCLDYSYSCDKLYDGVYLSREFPSEETAEQCLRSLKNQAIAVRLSPNKPGKSQVLDSDLLDLLPPRHPN